jgi:CheY-like chemotaxis protein
MASSPAVSPSHRPVILLVDDNSAVLLTRRLVLERAGYYVLTAETAEQALQTFAENNVALVITDYFLGARTGTGVAAEMKLLKAGVPILLSSGSSEIPTNACSVDGFVMKATPVEEFFDTVRFMLASAGNEVP